MAGAVGRGVPRRRSTARRGRTSQAAFPDVPNCALLRLPANIDTTKLINGMHAALGPRDGQRGRLAGHRNPQHPGHQQRQQSRARSARSTTRSTRRRSSVRRSTWGIPSPCPPDVCGTVLSERRGRMDSGHGRRARRGPGLVRRAAARRRASRQHAAGLHPGRPATSSTATASTGPTWRAATPGYVNADNAGFLFDFALIRERRRTERPDLRSLLPTSRSAQTSRVGGYTLPGKHTIACGSATRKRRSRRSRAMSVDIFCDQTSSATSRRSGTSTRPPTTSSSTASSRCSAGRRTSTGAAIEVDVDGHVVGTAHLRASRPDVRGSIRECFSVNVGFGFASRHDAAIRLAARSRDLRRRSTGSATGPRSAAASSWSTTTSPPITRTHPGVAPRNHRPAVRRGVLLHVAIRRLRSLRDLRPAAAPACGSPVGSTAGLIPPLAAAPAARGVLRFAETPRAASEVSRAATIFFDAGVTPEDNELLTRVGPVRPWASCCGGTGFLCCCRKSLPCRTGRRGGCGCWARIWWPFAIRGGAWGCWRKLVRTGGPRFSSGATRRAGCAACTTAGSSTWRGAASSCRPSRPTAGSAKGSGRRRIPAGSSTASSGPAWGVRREAPPCPSSAGPWRRPNGGPRGRYARACNWLQALEGDVDTVHLGWLHARVGSGGAREVAFHAGDRLRDIVVRDRRPVLHVVDTPAGLSIGARRDDGAGGHYWRVSQFLMPIFTSVPAIGQQRRAKAWVPLDDEHTLVWEANWYPTEESAAGKDASGERRTPESGMLPDTEDPLERGRFAANRENDYRIDRDRQRTSNFSGIEDSPPLQDAAVQESMGPIVDRRGEHLVASDEGVIRVRRRLVDAARRLRASPKIPPVSAFTAAPTACGGCEADGPAPGRAPSGVLDVDDATGSRAGRLGRRMNQQRPHRKDASGRDQAVLARPGRRARSWSS